MAPNAAAEDARSTTVGTLAIWLDIGAVCAVPLFVMLSGSVLLDPRRYGSHSVFLRKRAARLVPALVFWHLWYWVLVSRQDGTGLPWRDALLETVTGELYAALYFFWIIIGLALITPLVIGFVSTSSRRAVLVAGAALATIPALSLATIQPLIQPDGLLRVLARGIGARLGTTLGAATLGVFGLHLTFVWLLPELGIGGDLPASEAVRPMLGRLTITLVASFAIVLVLRRVPVVRSVL